MVAAYEKEDGIDIKSMGRVGPGKTEEERIKDFHKANDAIPKMLTGGGRSLVVVIKILCLLCSHLVSL